MLEAFEILTTSGVVLWSKSYAPVGAHIINSLINDVFIEEKVVSQNSSASGVSPIYKKEKYTLKWKRVKEFNLIFVVRLSNVACSQTILSQVSLLSLQAVYQSLLHLGWIDKLLDNISTIFIDLYKDQLRGKRARITVYRFDPYFEQQVRELEDNTGSVEAYTAEIEEKKDPLVSSDNGGPPPPPIPGLKRGMIQLDSRQ